MKTEINIYSWDQINKALMAQGTPPKQILRFLSELNKQIK